MDFPKVKTAYFLGIGGIGMSAIARYFLHEGIRVMGYDKTPGALTQDLEHEGMQIHYEDLEDEIAQFKFLPEDTLVVYTPAVPADHGELKWFRTNNFRIMKRSEVVWFISREHYCIAVAGTHGKTTTSTLIAHILKQSKVDCSAFLGGISANYNSNLLLAQNDARVLVAEADEFDRSFLTLHPSVAVITSTDADHLDIYKNHQNLKNAFIDFGNNLVPGGLLIIRKNLDIADALMKSYAGERKIKTYAVNEVAGVYAKNIRPGKGEYLFDLVSGTNVLTDLRLGIPGLHNVENA